MNTETAIQEKDYLRQRLEPRHGDADYLHLSDLLIALREFASDAPLTILDYGAGGSPYRALFPQADYRRADFAAMNELDYVFGPDSRIEERDATFDLILSTQVAEHVEKPAAYFAEVVRLLKPGGRLICTTHGTYPDHGCPYDFQRWTADGLKRDLTAAGLEVEKAYKLTTNARAVMYLIQKFSGWFETDASRPGGFALRGLRSLFHRAPRRWQRAADRYFPATRVVAAEAEGHEFYLGLVVTAVKGAAARPL